MKKFLLVNSTNSTAKTSEATIFGHKHLIVEGGGSIIADTVMNGILYTREFVESLAQNTKEIPAPFSHPSDDDGNFLLAESVQALVQNWGGVHARNWRMDGDRLVRDFAIDLELTGNAKKDELVRRVQANEDTDSSTGLILNLEEKSGIGRDGEEYKYVAIDGFLNHDAILLNEIGAATSNMGVGVIANSNGDKLDVVTYECNASMPAMNLPLAPEDTKWDASAADKLIREYTNSTDEPSSTYRRYFLYFDRSDVKNYGSYKLPFATIIDGKPYAVLNAINNASSRLPQTKGLSESDKSSAQKVIDHYKTKAKQSQTNSNDESWVKRNLRLVMNKLGIKPETETHEDNSMDLIKAALNEAGIKTEGLTDAELYAANTKMIIANAMKEGGKDKTKLSDDEEDMTPEEKAAAKKKKAAGNSDEAPEWAKTLLGKVNKLETAINSDKEAALNAKAKQVAALNMGISEEVAKTMGVKGCDEFLAKNSGFVNAAWSSNSTQSDSDPFANMEAPE